MISDVALRFRYMLDRVGSHWRRSWKIYRLRRVWGERWADCSRTGRVYSRVKIVFSAKAGGSVLVRRQAPVWAWTCPNCHEHSEITEAMVPALVAAWEAQLAELAARGVRFYLKRPTAATAGCPNCKFLPGDPE